MPLKPARFDGKPLVPEFARVRRLAVLALLVTAAATARAAQKGLGNIFAPFARGTGRVQSLPSSPSLDRHNAFFEVSLGTNGQACVTCHQANQGVSINVAS